MAVGRRLMAAEASPIFLEDKREGGEPCIVRVFRYVLIVAALTVIGLAAVGARARTTRLGYEMAAERARERQLLDERARLRFELAQLSTPARIEEQANALDLRRLGPADAAPAVRPTRIAEGRRPR